MVGDMLIGMDGCVLIMVGVVGLEVQAVNASSAVDATTASGFDTTFGLLHQCIPPRYASAVWQRFTLSGSFGDLAVRYAQPTLGPLRHRGIVCHDDERDPALAPLCFQ